MAGLTKNRRPPIMAGMQRRASARGHLHCIGRLPGGRHVRFDKLANLANPGEEITCVP